MKNFYFNLNQLPSKNDGGQSCDGNRQSRLMLQSGCGVVDVPMTSYGAPDEHPMSIRSASDGERWQNRVWKYVAMIFAVLVLSIANIGQMWGEDVHYILVSQGYAPLTKKTLDGSYNVLKTDGTTIGKVTSVSSSITTAASLYYNSTSSTYTDLTNTSNYGTSSGDNNTLKGINIGKGNTATINLGSQTFTKIDVIYRCNSGSAGTLTIAGEDVETSSTSVGLKTKTGSFSSSFTIKATSQDYRVVVILTREYSPSYAVTYDANGGSGVAPSDANTYESDDPVTVLGKNTLSKSGYIFAGWNTAANGSGTPYSPGETMNTGAGNVTLHAQWDTEVDLKYVWKTGNNFCDDNSTSTTTVNMISENDYFTLTGTGVSQESGSSLNIGKAEGNYFLITAKSGHQISSICFNGKIESTNVNKTTDNSDWSGTIASTGTGSDKRYTLDNINSTYFGVKLNTADKGIYIRNMVITMTVAPASPGYKLSVFNSSTNGEYNFVAGTGENEIVINNFVIPEYTAGGDSKQFWVGPGSYTGHAKNEYFSWKRAYHQQNNSCTSNLTLGSPVNAIGTLHAWTNSDQDNYGLCFEPNGYGIVWGKDGSDWTNVPFESTADATVWLTDTLLLTSDMIINYKYYVGLLTNSGGYVGSFRNEGDARGLSNTDNISSMRRKTASGDNWANGLVAGHGKFRIWVNNCTQNFYCHYIPHYVLYYNANGGDGAPEADYVSVEETPCQWSLSTTQPTWADHVFLGWSTNSSATAADENAEVEDLGTPYTASGDVTLYAVWTACSGPTITAFSNSEGHNYNQGDAATTMSITASAGNGGALHYHWYQYNVDQDPATQSVDAVGYTDANTYTPSTASAHGQQIFYCVVSEEGCSKTTTSAKSGAIAVTAATYTVTYNKNGDGTGGAGSVTGTVPTDATAYSSGARAVVLEPGDLALSGKTFIGWNDAPNGSGTYYSPQANFAITASTTLYAQWRTASSCPGSEGGTVYSLSMGDNSKGSSKALTFGESVQISTLSYATITNGNASFTDIRTATGETKATITKANPALINFGGAAAMLAIYLDCPLQDGDQISFTGGNSEICFTASPTHVETIATSSKSLTISTASHSSLIGKKIIYIWRKGGDTFGISALTITRPEGCSDPVINETTTRSSFDGGSWAAGSGHNITITATGAESYEWYRNTSASDEGATKLSATGNTIDITTEGSPVAGTTYFFKAVAKSGACSSSTKWNWCGAMTITAAPLYTVTFNTNGGSAQTSITQESAGASITMPSAPTKDDNTFQGWVIGGTTYAAGDNTYTPTANITAYASWKADCAGGGGSSGTTLFSQNFNSAMAVAYEADIERTYKVGGTTLSGLVGNSANLFNFVGCDKKGNCGIGVNSETGANSKSYAGKFGAYANNTSYKWALKTADLSATAPTAVKVTFDALLAVVDNGTSKQAVTVILGNGFEQKTNQPAASNTYTGFTFYTGSSSSKKHAISKVGSTTLLSAAEKIDYNTEKSFTWVVNNTGSNLDYTDPKGATQTLATGTWDLWMGTTLLIDGTNRQSGSGTFSGSVIKQLYIGSPNGVKHEFLIDNIVVTDLTPAGGGCYYVTYNGNGAEAGSISDATAHTSGSNVTVLGNTGGSAFTKTGYRFNGWNTSATGNGTAYAAGATISSISADVTLYAQWVADACSAPSAPTINGTSVRTVGQNISLNAECASGADASTTYTWYKGDTWETKSQVQAALTAGEGGRIFNKASCTTGDAGKYWCEASNGDGCAAHNATGFTVTVNDAAGDEHIYYYKDENHYSDGVYSNPEGNTASNGDNKTLSSPWMICNACMTGVDSVVAHGATYDGKGNWVNAYIKIPKDGTATTNNIKFALSAGYTGTLTIRIGKYKDDSTVPTASLKLNGEGDAITPTSGSVGGVATTENSLSTVVWPLNTAGGTYILTVASSNAYISQIDMTTSTTAKFNVTYDGNGKTGGTVPTDATNYIPSATVTVAANTGDGKLVKTNYTGAGWNTANNGTGTNYVPGSGTFTITANTTLYAHWTQLITLAPGAQSTGTNNAAVSWNGSVLRGFAAHTASGYALQGYYTEPSGGTKVLNADGSFAATDIDGFVTGGKWSNTGAAPTLYAQWEASSLLKWNLKVNVSETSITTLSKESAAPTVIAVANMSNLTNNGSLTITGSAKSALTSKIATTASAIGNDAGKYMSVQFIVAAGYQLVPSDIKVKVQPISHSQTTKLILEDNNSQSISYTSGSLSKGSTHTVTMTNSEEVAFTGTVKLKIYVYGTAENDGYRLGTPIEINGSVEATCATPPTFDGLSYDATEYTVGGASASAISVTGAMNVDTYLWMQNSVNDRSGGEAASGTNNSDSYTPPTSATGTTYYWCEMTNTSCGITIKTPAVGITVRNATTATSVTWSDVKLNDATATPNYGGGNYVLRATVDQEEWTGTLAASMITAPAGITIHDVTTGKDGSNKNYIEFQFDVTTAFDRASNATIDFNIALPEISGTPGWSELNSVKSVSYNDCSGGTGAAGMVYIPLTATQTTAKSEMQYYWETAEAGRVAANYGGSAMSSTNNSTGYLTADHTFNYYAASTNDKWMFQTYVGGVNKVRVAFYAQGALKSSNLTIKKFLYDTEYFSSQGDRDVSIGEVNASQASFAAGENGYIEFTVPEMAANTYAYFVTGSSNMKIYGLVLYTENAGSGGSEETNPVWSGSLVNGATVNKNQSDANFTYTISTTTNTLGAISYSSSDPSVAAVDPVTGEVTITATGTETKTAVITATLARSGCYQGATRTYTVQVTGLSCSEPSGSIELTSGSATKCASESVTLTMTGFTEGASIQWYNGASTISSGGGYTITTTATQSTLTTTAAGTYSAIATSSCAAKRTNSITIANMDMSEQKTVRKVSRWYVKNGRLTPDIALWQLGDGETFKSVEWSPANATGLDFVTRNGIVYLEGKEPAANNSEDKIYTLTLTVRDACGTDHKLTEQTIALTHQKNTDKHVLAFVVNGTAKGGFTEGITAAQTTSVGLYNAIAAQFDVQATNIYSTDDEQKLREYYSQYDILCITDYPNTQTKGANSKSYVDAIGALIDIRPILTMEAFVSALSNWKLKGVSGSPKSPSTRQYTMLLQCKDHEIFSGTTLTKVGEGLDAMYRVTMVDKSQEEYKTLDANYGDGEHKANEGYQYGKKPALQGFTYTEEMSDNDMLPLGLIDDGAGNDLQVGIERQAVMEARMMVLGINSYAMERLDKDGKTVVINALKYLMKKNAEDIADCSVYFDGSDESDPTSWDNELNWGPSYASLPLPHQEVRILKECVVKDGVVGRASGVKIIHKGKYNHGTTDAEGSLTIEPGGALIVDGKVRAAAAPNYFKPYPTTPANLYIAASETKGNGTLIFNNEEGETQATVGYYSKATTNEGNTWNWQYMAVPFNDNSSAYRNFYDSYLYRWAEDCSGWEVVPNQGPVYPWLGYTITQVGQKMYYMDGTLVETTEQTFSIPAGKNLVVGNSWTAPIQVKQLEDDDLAGMSKNIYLFNTGYDPNGEGAFDKTDGRYEAGTYVTVPIHASTYTGDSLISSLQAFTVYATSDGGGGTFTLNYDRHIRPARTTDNLSAGPMHAPRRAKAREERPVVLKIWASGSRFDDRVVLLEREDFSTGEDAGWDGNKRLAGNASPLIYTVTDNGKEAVSAIPDFEGTLVGFWAGEDNTYTFRFEYDEAEEEELYLLDTDNNTYTLISNQSSYTFTVPDKNAHTRFLITRQAPQVATGVEEVQGEQEPSAKAYKFIRDNKMFILLNGVLYDATGKIVVR